MCSESQSAYDDFLEINKDSNEPCIKAVGEALKDHNENCKTANAKNKEIIIADFLIKEWDDLINDYRRALGGKKPVTEDPIPLKPDEDKRGYLGGPEWGGLGIDADIIKGGGFSICTQPVKYNRGVNAQSGIEVKPCADDHFLGSSDSACDRFGIYNSDHTTHYECRWSTGMACTINSEYNTSSQTRGFADLGTEMCYLQGMPYDSFNAGPTGGNAPPAIGHSAEYRGFIRERCGNHGCSPKKPTTSDIKCSDSAGSRNTTKYWGSQLLECGYNKDGIDKRILEFPKTRLGRGKFLDRISENSNKIHGTGNNIITEDDILDYYISKLNSRYPNAKLTKENIRENTGPIKNSAGFAAEGVIDDAGWNPDPREINEIKVDAGKSDQLDKLSLPNCCSNTINLGDGSRAMLSDINQSCSFSSTTQKDTQTDTHTDTDTHTQIQPQPQPENASAQNPDPNEGFFSAIPDWVYIVGLVIIALVTLLIIF